MAAASDEFKFAQAIEKFTDRVGLDYSFTVVKCLSRGPAIQQNIFDLILNFLSAWAFRYSEGTVTQDHKMYSVCEKSWHMMNALHDTGAAVNPAEQ